jgi:outer membrane protein OmpA-like peptidoglycan-associated protein
MKHSSHPRRVALLALVVVTPCLLTAPALAQNYDVKSFHGRTPTSEELIESLKPAPAPAAPSGIKFRGIRPVEATKPKAVALSVQFEFNSAELTSDAKVVLDSVGKALRSTELGANAFVIEGHTDSVGGEDYNQRLSEARAAAVKGYLTSNYGIQASRLEAVGRGKSYPLDKANPESAVNRRVQIVTVR